jgi:hypothetical protein
LPRRHLNGTAVIYYINGSRVVSGPAAWNLKETVMVNRPKQTINGTGRFNVFLMRSLIAVMTMAAVLLGGQASVWAKANSRIDKRTDPAVKAAFDVIAEKEAAIQSEKLAAIEKNLTGLEQQWGIQFMGLRSTAGGYMLDLRFRVVDADKAFPLLRRHVKRYVVVEKSGAVLRIPFTAKLGSMRATVRTSNMVKTNGIYASLFANPGHHVKPGDKVSVVIGNFLADNVTVQ